MDTAISIINNKVNANSNYNVIFNNQLINNFINYIDVNDLTIKGYIGYIKQFIIYLKDNNIMQPTRDTIKAYKKYLDNKQLSTGTKQQYFRACKYLFKWLASEGLYPNVADNIKGFKVISDNTKKESLNEDDIIRILSHIDTSDEVGKRDYAMILLAVIGGLRISELANINRADIQVIKGEYVVYILGKGHTEKDTYIKVIEPVYRAIKDYLESKSIKNDVLFTSTSNRALGKRLTRESISQIIKGRFRDAGYDTPKITAHSLRHSSHTLLFKSGADLFKVQQHARHLDPKTTEIYLHVADRDLDTSELDIYNQIFNKESLNITKEIKSNINNLTTSEQRQVLDFITNIKGGANM